jgi:hypothetical protein
MIFGIVHSLITAGQPLAVMRFKHKSDAFSGWAVDCVVDGLDQLLRRLGFAAENVIGIGSKFAESCKGLGMLCQAQDSDQELPVVVLWKRVDAGDFLVEFSNVKAFLGQVNAGKVNLVEDGPIAVRTARLRGIGADRYTASNFSVSSTPLGGGMLFPNPAGRHAQRL